MASVRKKYNAAAKAQQHKARVLRLADFKIRSALKGVTVAYNSSWGDKAEFYPTGMERIVKLLKGDIDTACGALVQIKIRWRIYITITCETEDGELYCYAYPVIDRVDEMQRLEDEIEDVTIPAYLKKRVHVKDWGYWGEIV